MTGIDTNVLMRFVVQDDPRQSAQADAFFASLTVDNLGYLSMTTIVESVWVLERVYKLSKVQVQELLARLLRAPEVILEQSLRIGEAVALYVRGADFADAMIASAGRAAGCKTTVSFDRGAIKHAQMTPLP